MSDTNSSTPGDTTTSIPNTNVPAGPLPIYGWGAVPAETLPGILIYPDVRLREKCAEVTDFDERLVEGVRVMAAVMMAADNALAIAAPQVGVGLRVIVLSPTATQYIFAESPTAFVNPVIVNAIGPLEAQREGCLSFPSAQLLVERSSEVVVQAKNTRGESFELTVKGHMARVIQHEVEHLDGKLLIDHAGPLKRQMMHAKATKLLRRLKQTAQLRAAANRHQTYGKPVGRA